MFELFVVGPLLLLPGIELLLLFMFGPLPGPLFVIVTLDIGVEGELLFMLTGVLLLLLGLALLIMFGGP